MQINVAQLLKSSQGSTRDYELSDKISCDGNELMVKGQVKLTRTNRGVLAEGQFATETEVNCSRCLRPFACPLNLKIEEEYFPTIDINTGNPVVVSDEPGAFSIDEHHILDLTEALCQYSIIAIPMKPLCCPDCPGLCPTCGKDLNQGPCGCPPQEIDPRWNRLKDLLSASKE